MHVCVYEFVSGVFWPVRASANLLGRGDGRGGFTMHEVVRKSVYGVCYRVCVFLSFIHSRPERNVQCYNA